MTEVRSLRGGDTTVLPTHRVTRQLWRGSAKARRAKHLPKSRLCPPHSSSPKTPNQCP
eukprot:COSAG05_NODE_19026_length_299_cov_0.660000_1_plen_57_part_10